jgi:hypothetical protein
MRYRHLQLIAEREQRRAEQRRLHASEVARVLWESLDARQRHRWVALNALLEDNGS